MSDIKVGDKLFIIKGRTGEPSAVVTVAGLTKTIIKLEGVEKTFNRETLCERGHTDNWSAPNRVAPMTPELIQRYNALIDLKKRGRMINQIKESNLSMLTVDELEFILQYINKNKEQSDANK